MRRLVLAGLLLASSSFAQPSPSPSLADVQRQLTDLRVQLGTLASDLDRLRANVAGRSGDVASVRASLEDVSARVYAVGCFSALLGTPPATLSGRSCADAALPSARVKVPAVVSASRLSVDGGRLVVSVTTPSGTLELRDGRFLRAP